MVDTVYAERSEERTGPTKISQTSALKLRDKEYNSGSFFSLFCLDAWDVHDRYFPGVTRLTCTKPALARRCFCRSCMPTDCHSVSLLIIVC